MRSRRQSVAASCGRPSYEGEQARQARGEVRARAPSPEADPRAARASEKLFGQRQCRPGLPGYTFARCARPATSPDLKHERCARNPTEVLVMPAAVSVFI